MNFKELRELRSEIIEEYYNGKSIEDLMDIYSSCWTDIYRTIVTSFECTYKNITDVQKNEACNLYKNGMSVTKIGEKLKIHDKLILKNLEDNNIPRVHNGKRMYKLNEHYFDKIDTLNKAYILGFLYADGYNSINKSTITMSLEEKDKEILEKIRLEIGSERKLEFVNHSKRKDEDNDYHYHDMWRLLIFSTHMCNILNCYGMMQNKSLKLKFPDWLDPKLYSHFIKGYFDGDGSLSCYNKNGKFQPLISITSTNDFCIKCLDVLRKYAFIGGGIYDASSHNGITKILSVCGVNQVSRVLEWLYKDADLYMKRKYDKYQANFKDVIINNSQSA